MIENDRGYTQPTLLSALTRDGWAKYQMFKGDEKDVFDELTRIGDLLGSRTMGRAGALEELIQPQTSFDAHPRSLSAHFGLNALPLHVELSHRPRPCRYLILGCLDPGSPSAGTMTLDWRTLGFSLDELDILKGAPILVRSGRRSFYATLLSPDNSFLRYDPGCIEAVDPRGRAALDLIERQLQESLPKTHEWRRGDILVIDNWRVMHGRAPSASASGRRLARILIDA